MCLKFHISYLRVGKGGLEPPRLAAHDPKSCSSASSDTPPPTSRFYLAYFKLSTGRIASYLLECVLTKFLSYANILLTKIPSYANILTLYYEEPIHIERESGD